MKENSLNPMATDETVPHDRGLEANEPVAGDAAARELAYEVAHVRVPSDHLPGRQEADREPASGEACTPMEVKQLAQELLKHGYLEEAAKPALFRRAIARHAEVEAALEPLDLTVQLDTHRGVAVVKVAGAAYASSVEGQSAERRSTASQGDAEGMWAHPLVRRQRLTLEQSLLVAILRQAFVLHEQESGVGHSAAKVSLDELLPQFLVYFGDSGSDAKNESRLSILLDQLKTHAVVSEVDKNQEVTIRPLIAHLANPESLAALLRVLKDQASANATPQQPAAAGRQNEE